MIFQKTMTRTETNMDAGRSLLAVPTFAYLIVRVVLAVVLVVAAALKLEAALSTRDGDRVGDFAIAEYEFMLAALLLSGWRAKAVSRIAFGTFAIYAGVSAQAMAAGVNSCGCAGRMAIAPMHSLWIDLAALLLLVACSPAIGRRIPCAFAFAAILGIGGVLSLDAPRRIAAVGSTSATSFPEAAPSIGDATWLVCVPREHNLGALSPSTVSKTNLRLRNVSQVPVTVSTIKSPCSCVEANLADGRVIQAMSSLDVGIALDARRLPLGPFQRAITIVTSTGARDGATTAVLTGNVDEGCQIRLIPSALDFGEVAAGATARKQVRVRCDAELMSRIPEVIVLDDNLSFRSARLACKRRGIEADKMVAIAFRAPLIQRGMLRGGVTFDTDVGCGSALLPITADVTGALTAEPRRVVLRGHDQTLTIRSAKGIKCDRIKITAVDCTVPLAWRLQDYGTRQTLILRWDGELPPANAQTGELTITTSVPTATLRVPVVVLPPSAS